MLFKSNGKFIDDITDSFNRFGLQTKLSEKGTSKNTQKFEMYDSIHDSSYVAVAVEKPAGKMADKEWKNIIENDLLPTLVKDENIASSPASALIVPSKDIDTVEKMLIDKGFSPSIYQLFPGYVVAGINKKDTAKLIDEYKIKKEKDNAEKQKEEAKEEDVKENVKEEIKENKATKKDNENIDIEKQKADTLNSLSNIENKKPNKVKEQVEKNQSFDVKQDTAKKAGSSLAKKLAAAALLGTAIGAGAVAAPEISSQINNYMTPKEEKLEREVLEKAAERYFEGIKNGFNEDEYLLKLISENPNLAQEYINELANTPVQTSALKNSSASEDLLREKADSDNETIRAAVAQNPNTPKDVLRKLAKDKSNNVLKALAKNPAISKDMMEELSNYTGLHNDMMENPALTPEIMRKITAGKNRDCEFNKKYMANPCISAEELLYNLNNPDECIRHGIALNPNTPAEAIEKLAQDNNPLVKSAAYKNKNMPKEKLEALFPENWVREYDNNIKEAERVAALENPNISPEIRRKAVFMDMDKYGKAVAKNKATSPELINSMKNMAQGKKGVSTLLYKANNIKNNPKELAYIKEQMDKNNEPLEKPVRRLMNKQFVENVYDPYKLIEDIRRIPSGNKKYNLKKDNNKNNNGSDAENNNGRNNILENITPQGDVSISILDKNGNAPEKFSTMPLPALEKGAVSYNPEAEKQALKTADDIIDSIMNDSLPDIKKAIDSANYIKNGGGNAGNNSANNAGQNNGGYFNIGKSTDNGIMTENHKKIYENACREIDQLKKMF